MNPEQKVGIQFPLVRQFSLNILKYIVVFSDLPLLLPSGNGQSKIVLPESDDCQVALSAQAADAVRPGRAGPHHTYWVRRALASTAASIFCVPVLISSGEDALKAKSAVVAQSRSLVAITGFNWDWICWKR